MSAERYEIFDDGPCIRIVSPDSTISTIVGRPVGYHIDDAVIGAIRQQARDLEQLRTDLAAAVAELAWLRSNTKQSATFDLWFLDASESEETVESTLFGPARDIGRMQEALRYLDATIIERNKLFNALNRAGFTECDALLKFITERDALKLRAEQAEARLAAIDNAPTVAVVSECAAGLYVHQKLFGAQLAEPSAELIYRPTKDQA